MTELTDEQIDRAVDCAALATGEKRFDREYARHNFRAAAPFLQLPWDEPSDAEIDVFSNIAYGRTVNVVGEVCRNISQMVLREFVRRRNATLLPKPVDSRRAAILKAYKPYGYNPDEELMAAILDALDEVK